MIKRAYTETNLVVLLRHCRYALACHHHGFTLIELIVVITFVGILATLGLPVLFSQVGRAREAETKSNLSAIGQAQQTYFFENSTFAGNYNNLEVSFQSNYYTYPQPILFSLNSVRHQANPIDGASNATRTFSLGIYYVNQTYSVILCRSLNTLTTTEAPNTNIGSCSNSGIQEF